MDEHIKNYFCQYSEDSHKGNFHKVVALHEAADINWESISRIVPTLPKGWFEICQLPTKTRIQFIFDFWLSKIPYHPYLDRSLSVFFRSLDDIGVFLTQKKYDDLFEAQMVYSVSRNRGFYRGAVGASDAEIRALQKLFPEIILPEDYLAFLQIHNGFCKSTDCTGITSTFHMEQRYAEFQKLLDSGDAIMTRSKRAVNPQSLIPFYESFGMPFFQCFWGEWHPEREMGNVYYNSLDNTISDPIEKEEGSPEQLSFPTFTDWLIFYLEQIEV